MGFVHDEDVHGSLGQSADLSPAPDATPIRPTLTMEEIGNSAGALLRYHRERMGYTMQHIASLLKVRTTTIADLENDRLAQETAVKFTKRLLKRYASVLDLDEETVIHLYMQKVNSTVKITQEISNKSKRDGHLRRDFLVIVLILLVAGGGYFIFGGQDAQKDQTAASGQIVSGQITPDGQEVVVETPVVIEDPRNAKADIKPLSENTVKAQAQAQALNTSTDTKSHSEVKQPVSLPLSEQTVERKKAQQAEAIKQAEANKQAEQAKQHTPQAEGKHAQSAEGKIASKSETATKGDSGNAKSNASETKDLSAESKDNSGKSIAEANAKDDKNAQDDKAESAPRLENKLKDISSQVKIVNRENTISSLNQVEFTVLKDVALEVTASGKVLKSGVFKSGDKFKLVGIPPFMVSVSDTSAVRINYLDGLLQTPNAKQVTFKLPKY